MSFNTVIESRCQRLSDLVGTRITTTIQGRPFRAWVMREVGRGEEYFSRRCDSRAELEATLDNMIAAIEFALGIYTDNPPAAMVAAIHRASHNAHHTEAAAGVYRQQVKADL